MNHAPGTGIMQRFIISLRQYTIFATMNMETIKTLAARYRDETANNLSALIQAKSLSMGEGKVQNLLMQQMEKAGFDQVRMDGLGNVIGRIGSGKRLIAFDAHMDTVDLGNEEAWNFDPLGGAISDGWVHGRGTVDQKGGAAAFVTAGRIIRDMGFDRDVTLLFVGSVMEEDCDGLCWKYLVEEEGIKPHVVVVTEPTNMKIARGHRGRMEIGVTIKGVSCHGSAPERGVNAVYKASRLALEIEKLNDRLKEDAFLGKGSVTVTDIRSMGPSLCAVPDHAHIHLDRRLTWGETMESALAEIEALTKGMEARVEVLDYAGKSFTGLEYGMKKYYPTWKLPVDHPVIENSARAFSLLFGEDPIIDKWTFSTNGVTINGMYGIPVVGFGPGDESLAHAPNEKVSVDQLEQAAAFYAALAYVL